MTGHDAGRAIARAPARNLGALDRGLSGAVGLALAGFGLRRRTRFGGAMTMLGTGLLGRMLTGRCPVYRALGLDSTRPGLLPSRAPRIHRLEEAITLLCPMTVVERQLRRLDEVPRWLPPVEAVEEAGNRSRWRVKRPRGEPMEWEIEVESEAPGRIAWRSVEHSPRPVQGEILLRSAPADRGTELTLQIEYPGASGRLAEKPLRQELREGLRRFKQLVEAGEIATTRGQPSGRVEPLGGAAR